MSKHTTPKAIALGGSLIMWSPVGETDLDALIDALPEQWRDFAPEPVTEFSALKATVVKCFDKHVSKTTSWIARPGDGDTGWCVVEETRGKRNSYRDLLSVDLGEDPEDPLQFEVHEPSLFSQADLDEAQRVYQQQRGLVPAQSITKSLTAVIETLRGVRVRPSGGVYWLANDRLPDWKEVTDAFESVGTRCYDVPHDMSPNAIRLVRDSIIAEVTTDAQCVVDEITDGSLGAKALANRIQIASELREKAALYERLLGEALPVITEKIDEIDNARAAAVIIQSTKEDEDAPKPAKKKARRS